ncbi:MAG: hypothetical protein KDD82_26505, partial [Planctomycetes bacterium]|nr:hypothetical protein [Planctomycetota bacterium]
MAELRTRYNELLGIPNEIKDPDLYQLLGLSRGGSLDGLDAAYRESMSTLQRIRSPKHKSFIEFLKGELRTAKATLGDPRKRAEYDARLLAERRSRVEIVLDVVLADGFLTPVEEARVVDMAAQSGLLPDEAQLVIEEQLERRGARRVEQRVAHP